MSGVSPNPNPIRFKMVSWRDLGGQNVEKTSPFLANFHGKFMGFTLRSFVAVCDLETMADLVP